MAGLNSSNGAGGNSSSFKRTLLAGLLAANAAAAEGNKVPDMPNQEAQKVVAQTRNNVGTRLEKKEESLGFTQAEIQDINERKDRFASSDNPGKENIPSPYLAKSIAQTSVDGTRIAEQIIKGEIQKEF